MDKILLYRFKIPTCPPLCKKLPGAIVRPLRTPSWVERHTLPRCGDLMWFTTPARRLGYNAAAGLH